MTVVGGPIPQFGEKNVAIWAPSGDIKSIRAGYSTVAKPLLSVKRMIESRQFVGFCGQGCFAFDFETGKVDWFREEGGNYIFDIWFVLVDEADEFINMFNSKDFTRPSEWSMWT